MTERLDRIEALLETTGQQQAKQTEDIDTLLGAIAQTDRQVRDLRGESVDDKQRFEVLRAEAQNDRQETRQLWNDAVTQMGVNRAANAAAVAELTEAVGAQSKGIDRLERGISQMVTEMTSQRETANNLIRLATALVTQRTS
ncbi:MAG: hypothetical protein WBA76_10380 [Phormidesmis sp.]